MATDVSICSAALSLLGDKPISSLTEPNRVAATLCANIYPLARSDILRSHPWNCLGRRVVLSPMVAAPAFEWGYQFTPPGGMLRIVTVGYDGDPEPYRYEGGVILLNSSVCRLHYLADVGEALWDAKLVERDGQADGERTWPTRSRKARAAPIACGRVRRRQVIGVLLKPRQPTRRRIHRRRSSTRRCCKRGSADGSKTQSPAIKFHSRRIFPRLRGRTDIEKFAASAEKLENMVVFRQGGATMRPSADFKGEVKTSANITRLIPFIYSRVDAFVLEFGNTVIRVWRDGVLVESSPGVPLEITSPYASSQLADLDFTQGGDTLLVFHPSLPVRRLRRFSTAVWTFDVAPFDPPAIFEFGHASQTTTFTLSAATVGAGRTVTAANAGFTFLASDVGRTIISGAGSLTITAYTSAVARHRDHHGGVLRYRARHELADSGDASNADHTECRVSARGDDHPDRCRRCVAQLSRLPGQRRLQRHGLRRVERWSRETHRVHVGAHCHGRHRARAHRRRCRAGRRVGSEECRLELP